MKYRVTVGGETFEVEVDGNRVSVRGVEHHAELRVVAGTPIRLLLLDGQSMALPMEPDGRSSWTVHDRGERFEVEVLDDRTAHIRSLVAGAKSSAGPSELKAPMPGLVIRIPVEAGQTVAAGASLVVLEAMKMENELRAKGPGQIESVRVAPGQVVEKGQTLLTFSASPEAP